MNSKKLLTLLIAPLFAVGMTACGPDQTADDDIWTEEGQLPAYETDRPYDDPAYGDPYGTQRDTIITPEPPIERPEEGVTPDTPPDADTQPRY